MSKIYPPLGYEVNYKGKDYYNGNNREEIAHAVLNLADWDEMTIRMFVSASTKGLKSILIDNGFVEEK